MGNCLMKFFRFTLAVLALFQASAMAEDVTVTNELMRNFEDEEKKGKKKTKKSFEEVEEKKAKKAAKKAKKSFEEEEAKKGKKKTKKSFEESESEDEEKKRKKED